MDNRKGLLFALLLNAFAVPVFAESVTLFRVFLNDGTAVVSYGDYARVGDRVIFSMPLGDAGPDAARAPDLHVVNLPVSAINWTATERYAESARFSHYVETKAEADYATLAGEVAATLNAIVLAKDPKARLAMAVDARRRLASWPKDHYGYRAADVREMLGLLDEATAALRAAAGETSFAIDFVAESLPQDRRDFAPLQRAPTGLETVGHAVAVARAMNGGAERVSLLRSIVAALENPRSKFKGSWPRQTRRWAVRAIDQEMRVEKSYGALMATSLERASSAAGRADVRAVERVLASVEQQDARLGRKRAEEVNALIGEIKVQLDAARQLRLARDRWVERSGSLKAYMRGVEPVVANLTRAQATLDDIKGLVGSSAANLVGLSDRLATDARALNAMPVPDELKPSHALLVSAVNLADQAVKTRRQAATTGQLQLAWDASSAAAGSMMLLQKAREDMKTVVRLPQNPLITPRQTRLFRVADLRAFQQTICRLSSHTDVRRSRNCAVIVPSAAAADQLRRTIEQFHLGSTPSSDCAVLLPLLLTRAGWYEEMQARLSPAPRRLSELEREVLLKAAAREAVASEVEAPFRLRPGLLVEMLALYDDLRRRDVSVDTFERLLAGDLERDADFDRGAERLLKQTHFLAAAFRRYEARRDQTDAVDEYTLRSALLTAQASRPLRQVIVTVGERSVDPTGLWPADLDLLARLPGLERIDIVATRTTIAAGLLDRLEKLLPGFEEGELPGEPGDTSDRSSQPILLSASPDTLYTVHRDREDELCSIARQIKRAGAAHLDRRAVVFKRPLPYVYLGHEVFADASIPYQTFDALPLAAEPFAAALDVVFEFVTSNFTRESVVALLGSPHLSFLVDGIRLGGAEIFALNRKLGESGFVGGVDRLRTLTGTGAKAARAAAGAADELRSLSARARPSLQLDALAGFLAAHECAPADDDPFRERQLRARRAILSAIQELRRAHAQIDDTPLEFVEVAAVLRRWIEGQTFAPRTGATGVQLLDASAARYGEFDDVFLVGLIDGEWPERVAKSIFYPASLLRQFDWPDSRTALAGERAAFRDLVGLARRHVSVSTFELENDGAVAASAFLDDLARCGLRAEVRDRAGDLRVFVHEALSSETPVPSALDAEQTRWLALRAGRTDSADARFHGRAAPYHPKAHSVSSLERYLQCPFRFFAERVLELREDPEDERTLNPRDLGIFVHEVFQKFFEEWNRRGQRSITPDNIGLARQMFGEVIEPLLARLPDDQATVQRTRLLGSAANEGLAEAVFQAEAEWETPVVERLLEQSLDGEFEIRTPGETRRVSLRGKADRIDLLADDSFRIVDYKLTRAPERKRALQLPVYSVCAVQHLRRTTGKDWQPGQAGYIAFGQERQFTPMRGRGMSNDDVLLDAQSRLLAAIDGIERGEFPPTPADPIMCTRCPHASVCRKDYVGDV